MIAHATARLNKAIAWFNARRVLLRTIATVVLVILFFLVPVYAHAAEDFYALILFGRVLVFAMAAVGLNFAMGYGGMVSMGHALYIGIGAYVVGLLSFHGLSNGWLHLAAAFVAVGVVATVVGLICLRTRGIAFIMITLAFAQLGYIFFVGLKQYGGDDGLSIANVSDFGVLTGNKTAMYFSMIAVLGIVLYGFRRLIDSRFGLVLRATRVNERRVNAVGIPTFRYRLIAYVISAEICGLAGYFLANLTSFASPAYMTWALSGELIAMVVLGGLGSLVGPVTGAASYLLMEEILKAYTEYWMIVLGPMIVFCALFLRRGFWGILDEDLPSVGGKK